MSTVLERLTTSLADRYRVDEQAMNTVLERFGRRSAASDSSGTYAATRPSCCPSVSRVIH